MRLLLVTLAAVAAVALPAAPANACTGTVCDTINRVCGGCIPR